MKLEKKWKSKPNPRTGNYHNIRRYVCPCGIIDTVHGSGSQDELHQNAAITESLNEMNRGINPPKPIP